MTRHCDTLQATIEKSSPTAGTLAVGGAVEVFQEVTNEETGVTRVRCNLGWCLTVAGDTNAAPNMGDIAVREAVKPTDVKYLRMLRFFCLELLEHLFTDAKQGGGCRQ